MIQLSDVSLRQVAIQMPSQILVQRLGHENFHHVGTGDVDVPGPDMSECSSPCQSLARTVTHMQTPRETRGNKARNCARRALSSAAASWAAGQRRDRRETCRAVHLMPARRLRCSWWCEVRFHLVRSVWFHRAREQRWVAPPRGDVNGVVALSEPDSASAASGRWALGRRGRAGTLQRLRSSQRASARSSCNSGSNPVDTIKAVERFGGSIGPRRRGFKKNWLPLSNFTAPATQLGVAT